MNRHPAHGICLAFLALALIPSLGESEERLDRKLRVAGQVFQELLESPDHSVPTRLLEESRCLAVIPKVIKAALGWGGRRGKGVLTCRNSRGVWSPPIFVNLTGGSIGFQIGGQSTDFVLFFMNQRSIESLLKSKFTLGGDASIAAGPLGRTAEAATDLKLNAEIYSYAKSRGLFAGISAEGSRLAPNKKATYEFYGKKVWPEEVLLQHRAPSLPRAARRFLDMLP